MQEMMTAPTESLDDLYSEIQSMVLATRKSLSGEIFNRINLQPFLADSIKISAKFVLEQKV